MQISDGLVVLIKKAYFDGYLSLEVYEAVWIFLGL